MKQHKIKITIHTQLVTDLDSNRTRQGVEPNTKNMNSVLTLLQCSVGMHVHVKGTWGQHKAHEVSSAACENQLNIATPLSVHLYSLTRSMKENTWQQHVSRTHNRLLMGGKKTARPKSQTRKLIYRVCVFSGMAAAFHFSSFPCPLRGPRLSGPPTNWGLHTRQVHHLASERMNTSLSNVFQMSAGILERVGLVNYPMTPCTSTTWPRGIVWACGVISMRRMYNNLLAYTNYKSKDKWTQKRRQTLCNLNEACGKYESLWSPQLFPTEEHYKPSLRRMRSIMKSIPKSWNCFTVSIFQGFDWCVNVLNMC